MSLRLASTNDQPRRLDAFRLLHTTPLSWLFARRLDLERIAAIHRCERLDRELANLDAQIAVAIVAAAEWLEQAS
jgi:hypothetical protein